MPPKKVTAKKGKRRAEESKAGTSEPKSKKAKKDESDQSEESSENDSDDEEGEGSSGEGTSKKGNWNFKISSWNVNGIRAWLKSGSNAYVKKENPDIICLQETKCQEDSIPQGVQFPGYHCYWAHAETKGYSGVGLCSKTKPTKVSYGIGKSKHDNEGRVITAEFKDFYLVTSYVPNSGRGLPRLGYRQEWDEDFREYLKSLDSKKPVILCGDLNVAHNPIDLRNPQSNARTAGFTKEERRGFTCLLNEGFVDTFRHLNPKKKKYTFWSYLRNARAKNIGWRLDYFVVSERFLSNVCDSEIRHKVKGSDHCPVMLLLAL